MEILPVSNGVDLDDEDFPVHWHELGETAVIVFSGGVRRQYDKLPFGAPETGEGNGTVDLGSLRWTEECDELRAAFINPFGTWHSFDLGDGSEPFETSTVIRFLWDNGIGATPTQLYFQGAITSSPPQEFPIENPGTESATILMNFTIVDLQRLCFQRIKPDYLARWVRNVRTPIGPYTISYELLFRDGDLTYAYVQCGRGVEWYSWYWRLSDLYAGLLTLATTAIKSFLRLSTAAISSGTHPFRTTHLHKQGCTRSTAPGDELLWDDLLFRGAVSDTDSLANATEGLLIDNGHGSEQQSLYRFESGYDLVKTWFASTVVKVTYENIDADQVHIVHLKPQVSRSANVTIPTILLTDQKPNPRRPGRAMRSVKWAVPGMSQRDLVDHEVPTPLSGIRTEELWPYRVLFHNLPHLGDDGSRGSRGHVTSLLMPYDQSPIGDFDDVDHVAVVVPAPFSMWSLYYRDRPYVDGQYLTTSEVIILVDSTVGISTGDDTEYYHPPFDEWPVYADDRHSNDPTKNGWADALLDQMELVQGASCIPYATAASMGALIGTVEQTLLEGIVVPMTLVRPDQLGDKVIIGTGDANCLLPAGETYGSFLRLYGIIVSYEGDMSRGEAKIDILGI
ncbi:MAG TPA: hypothetical protein VHI13_16850 [Candidatus Kapabacteria bacterium]|nr:hypothetical protein [Candidatus Kapabacteria bacterium]